MNVNQGTTLVSIAKRWHVSPQVIQHWRRLRPAELERILKLKPGSYVPLAERWGATSLDVARWPAKRRALLKRGMALNTELRADQPESLQDECHSRGFALSELEKALGLRRNTLYSWAQRERLRVRLWDALLGMEDMLHG